MLADAFGDLIEADERAFRRKFRKMAAVAVRVLPRQRAALLRRCRSRLEDPLGRRAHEPRVDPGRPARRELRHLHGLGRDPRLRRQRLRRGLPRPLHLGPAADGGQPRAARLRQGALGRRDRAHDRHVRARLRRAGPRVLDRRARQRVPAHAREHRGRAARRPDGRAAGDARGTARRHDDGRARRAALRLGSEACGGWRTTSATEVEQAYEAYLETIPEVKRQHSVSYAVKDVVGRAGFGIGSAGLPAYSLLVEGRTQALENDVDPLDEAGERRGGEPRARRCRGARLLRAPGPPDRGVAARAAGPRRPVAGLVRAARRRPGGQGGLAVRGGHRLGTRSPTSTRSSRCSNTSGRRRPRSTACRTRGATRRWSSSRPRRRSLAVVDGREEDVRRRPRVVRPRLRRPGARRPPAVRRRVPQRPDPRSAGGLTAIRLIAPLLLAAAGAAILVAVMENAGGDFSGWPEWQAIP